jgi:hypothetical protein
MVIESASCSPCPTPMLAEVVTHTNCQIRRNQSEKASLLCFGNAEAAGGA